jgi:hypothetical protein
MDVILEASHHCIWQSPKGELIDLTENFERILFVPDDYPPTGRPILSKHFLLTDDPKIAEFVRAVESYEMNMAKLIESYLIRLNEGSSFLVHLLGKIQTK